MSSKIEVIGEETKETSSASLTDEQQEQKKLVEEIKALTDDHQEKDRKVQESFEHANKLREEIITNQKQAYDALIKRFNREVSFLSATVMQLQSRLAKYEKSQSDSVRI